MLRSDNSKLFLPFLISLAGIIADHMTTLTGLSLGLYETHPQYHPALALIIFWAALTVLTLTLPKKRIWEMSKSVLASASFLGAVNNTLVILGVFQGLVI